MSLPNPSMSFSPFAILTAEEMNDLVENIEALADGSGLDDGSITAAKLSFLAKSTDVNGWTKYDYGNWKRYRKRFGPYSTGSITTLGNSTLSTSADMPVGVAPNDVTMSCSWNQNSSNSSQLVVAPNGYDASSTNNTNYTYSLTLRNITGSSVTYSGIYFVMELVTK